MAYQIRWSPRAVTNFEDICSYIEKDSAYYAALFAKRVSAIIKAIPDFPEAGRIVPEYEDKKLREKIYENYRIVYRVTEEAIEIITICHDNRPLQMDKP